MPETIATLTLTPAELAALADLVTPEEFDAWQRDALAGLIERKAAEKVSAQASTAVREAVQAARDSFPTVFAEPTPL